MQTEDVFPNLIPFDFPFIRLSSCMEIEVMCIFNNTQYTVRVSKYVYIKEYMEIMFLYKINCGSESLGPCCLQIKVIWICL